MDPLFGPEPGTRVVVGMSGGVDSSVAAALLLEQGYEVVGATMLVWSPPGVEMQFEGGCCGLEAAEDARRVCARLGVRHYTIDLRDEFYERIVKNYVEEYLCGRTPNPCVLCNEHLKYRALLDRAAAMGASAVATGHYARRATDPRTGRIVLLRAVDRRKDQTYALYRLSQEQLGRALFPLGEMRKEEVRERARQLGLPTAGKPDSQETCFVPGNDYPALLQLLVPDRIRPGEVVDPEGRILGRHEGTPAYTYGQRRRINVGSPRPLYVAGIDPGARRVTVAPREHPSLWREEVEATEVNLVALDPAADPGEATVGGTAQIRYNAPDQPCRITLEMRQDGPRLRARFATPVWAPAPGQSLVCYRGDVLLGGGVIISSDPRPERTGRPEEEVRA